MTCRCICILHSEYYLSLLFLIKFKLQCGVSFALFWFEECFECSQCNMKDPLRVNGGKMRFSHFMLSRYGRETVLVSWCDLCFLYLTALNSFRVYASDCNNLKVHWLQAPVREGNLRIRSFIHYQIQFLFIGSNLMRLFTSGPSFKLEIVQIFTKMLILKGCSKLWYFDCAFFFFLGEYIFINTFMTI